MYLQVILLILGVLSLCVICCLLLCQSTLNIAPLLDSDNKGIPTGPQPSGSVIPPTGSCLPPDAGFKACRGEADCRSCSERPEDAYLQCISPTYKQKITVNGVDVPADGQSYCLPPQNNVCSPGFSESVWTAEAGKAAWQCQCTYPEDFQLFRQATQDTDCNVPVACNRSQYRVCSNDNTKACDVDEECAQTGKCNVMTNRLVSVPRMFGMEECDISDTDPECVQLHKSNYATNDQGQVVSGSGLAGDPLLIQKQSAKGLKMHSWDPLVDGPLLTKDNMPSWLSGVTPDCEKNPADPACNPDCYNNPTNPGCSVADGGNWGGQCYCDPNQKLVSWKDYHNSTTSTATSFKSEEGSSNADYFGCMPDTCQVPEYVPLNSGLWIDPGPQLITRQNVLLDFTNEGATPPQLAFNTCWCGNIRQNADGTYVSYIPYKPQNQPNYPPTCVKDPCNPGGYWDATTSTCICNPAIANVDVSGNMFGSQCTPICDTQVCGAGGTCKVVDGKITCACNACHSGDRCEKRGPVMGQACDTSDSLPCCVGKCSFNFLALKSICQ